MDSNRTPLTLAGVFTSWRWDTSGVVACTVVAICYLWAYPAARTNGTGVKSGRALFGPLVGVGLWLLTSVGMIGVYSDTLFWVRALQVLLLMYVVPFALAAGKPITVVRDALDPFRQVRLDAALDGRVVRVLTYPLTGSALLLVTPWLLFLSPWLTTAVRHSSIDAATRLLLPVVGFIYFASRLQLDPVPRRFQQSVSLLITVVESPADGVLGIALWLGPLVAHGYFATVVRHWGPNPRTDQIVGAGVFWILGDVLGLPFLLTVMRAFSADERRRSVAIDAELDAAEAHASHTNDDPTENPVMMPGLWWENDPQLRERFERHRPPV